MAARRRADAQEVKATQRASGTARTLAETLPRLILEARKIAATVIHGLHGRKRAGPGEQFWQYRRRLRPPRSPRSWWGRISGLRPRISCRRWRGSARTARTAT